MADGLALVSKEDLFGRARQIADDVAAGIGEVILGKNDEIHLALTCLLARGHLLIEDMPGVGKTLMARALAVVLGLEYRRIQFTSDILPADIIGVSVFDQQTSAFQFHRGPLFAELVLADEVNRATPKAQSALLEAMEEHQVTADGQTLPLPDPFFVIATQNPVQQIGTFPLPESQLDRFLMRIGLGYPDAERERELLRGEDRRKMLRHLTPVLNVADVRALQAATRDVHVSDAILDYCQALVAFTRDAPQFESGLSPRAAVDLLNAARCHAMLRGHPGVRPEDVKAVFGAVAGHRLHFHQDVSPGNDAAATQVLEAVAVA